MISTKVILSGLATAFLCMADIPIATITPSRIVEGDTVTLWIYKAEHPNTCVPTFEVSYTIKQEPEEIYPPNYSISLFYTEVPHSGGGMCGAAMTPYGPLYTFTDLTEGTYTFRSDVAGGSFRVLKKDSVNYTVSTEKNMYTLYRNPSTETFTAQNLNVLYSVENNSQDTKKYNFTSGCQFDMTIQNNKDSVIYRYMDNRGCDDVLTTITLPPGEKTAFTFPSFTLNEAYGPCKITARMIGYEESAVSTSITVNWTTNVNSSNVPSRTGPHFKLTHTNGSLTLWLNHSQKVTLGIYTLNGKKVSEPCSRRKLQQGTHSFVLNTMISRNGVFIVRIEGDDIHETMLITMQKRK